MKILLRTAAGEIKSLELAYLDSYDLKPPVHAHLTRHEFDAGHLYSTERWFGGIYLVHLKFRIDYRTAIHLQWDKHYGLMSFNLKGEVWYPVDIRAAQLKEENGNVHHSELIELPYEPKEDTAFFLICLTKNYAINTLGHNLPPDAGYGTANFAFPVINIDLFQYARLQIILTDMMQDRPLTPARRIYLHAKVLELLALQMEFAEREPDRQPSFSDEDASRLQQARRLIENNIKSPCSLTELARRTGLNEFKLKKGFKQLFGNTVFGYLAELRMQQAYQYLQQGKSVNEVAYSVGYKNAQHFTAAFKKRFSILPSKVLL